MTSLASDWELIPIELYSKKHLDKDTNHSPRQRHQSLTLTFVIYTRDITFVSIPIDIQKVAIQNTGTTAQLYLLFLCFSLTGLTSGFKNKIGFKIIINRLVIYTGLIILHP